MTLPAPLERIEYEGDVIILCPTVSFLVFRDVLETSSPYFWARIHHRPEGEPPDNPLEITLREDNVDALRLVLKFLHGVLIDWYDPWPFDVMISISKMWYKYSCSAFLNPEAVVQRCLAAIPEIRWTVCLMYKMMVAAFWLDNDAWFRHASRKFALTVSRRALEAVLQMDPELPRQLEVDITTMRESYLEMCIRNIDRIIASAHNDIGEFQGHEPPAEECLTCSTVTDDVGTLFCPLCDALLYPVTVCSNTSRLHILLNSLEKNKLWPLMDLYELSIGLIGARALRMLPPTHVCGGGSDCKLRDAGRRIVVLANWMCDFMGEDLSIVHKEFEDDILCVYSNEMG
ncbi:hypothetical protein AJ80_09017 [Polytolypa hystricis UAMH7299]|uniref:BTB domain-containing protein n=1 Tax=Polytolypa hystricis (strain UAMH7299) TaxID=1447883 RepID=A0A2B7WXN4_POLH7|nr:hypothetical protein AJ80_09017 [Polytolypa hystricis UAMH7299]